MKQYLAAALVGALSMPAFATCPYPLDATAAQYEQSGFSAFDSVNYQSAEYLARSTQPAPGALEVVNLIALSDTGFTASAQAVGSGLPGGDIALPASGIVAFEIAIDRFPASEDQGANLYLGGGFTTGNELLASTSGDAISFNYVFANSGSGSLAGIVAGSRSNGVVTWANGNVGALALPLPANTRVGVYLNMNTRQVGYTLNGVNHGYLQSEQGGTFSIPAGVQSLSLALNGIMQVTSTSALIGQPLGATLVTDAAAFTQPFPAGTTDLCASANAGLRLPNGKPFPGKAQPRGLQQFQSLPLPVRPLGQWLKP